jgi:hypothetical protein
MLNTFKMMLTSVLVNYRHTRMGSLAMVSGCAQLATTVQ